MDKRKEEHEKPRKCRKNVTRISINPDIVGDFTDLPFPENTFSLVVMDPPHYTEKQAGKGHIRKHYGCLFPGWQEMLRKGFKECFRVLKPRGILIFKWCEVEIPLSRILELAPEKPLFGHRTGRRENTHWVTFIKDEKGGEPVWFPKR
jgi:SAM-dependent methyltransferase